MTEKEIKDKITDAQDQIDNYREMLKEGGEGHPISQIKENIHYWTGYKNAFEYVLKEGEISFRISAF